MGRRLGDPADPLLVSVRSGAKFSMPGMMETVLNVGLNDASVAGLAAAGRRRRPVRLGLLPAADPDVRQDRLRRARRGVRARARRREARPRASRNDLDLDADDLRDAGRRVQEDLRRAHRPRLPAGPARAARPGDQRGLRLVERRPRRALPPPGAHPGRPRHRGQRGRHGLRQPRRRLRHRRRVHPRPGHRRAAASTATTWPTPRARTSSPASATPCRCEELDEHRQDELRRADGASWPRWRGTTATCATSSSPSSAASCGCCRPGSASAPRRPRSSSPTQLVDEGVIDLDEALTRVTGAQLAQLMFPTLRPVAATRSRSTRGIAASPGAAVGKVVFDRAARRRRGRRGRAGDPGPPRDQPRRPARHDRRAGHPDQPRRQDLATPPWSPAAWARPASAAPTTIEVDLAGGKFTVDGTTVDEGDVISIDGTTGTVYLGEVPVQPSPVVQYFEGDARRARRRPAGRRGAPAAAPTPTHAAGSTVRTNADTGEDAGPGAPLRRRRASACAAPSTCSSATAASWSSG